MKRVDSLDYLRGAMAVSVMLYHYCSWSFGTLDGETLLGKLGIYAVSIFYILSGLSLTIVYEKRILNISDIGAFFLKRVFRIFPLFWLVVTAALVYKLLLSINGNADFDVSSYKIFLNYSLLFGFLEPTAYLSTGAWSIGNEMVFYSILPFVFLLNNRNKIVLPIAIIFSLAIGFYFSAFLLSPDKQLSEQWATYINPFNQIFLFMAGVAIGKWGVQIKNLSKKGTWPLILIIFLLFLFFPAQGDKAQIVTGIERWVFSGLSISLVWVLFVSNPKLPSWGHKTFSFLGQGCYSIYLLHPLICIPVIFVFTKVGLDRPFAYTLSFFLTLAVSWFTFKYIESPMMSYGKKRCKTLFKKEISSVIAENRT